ncbi:hypothetical protein CBS101457_004040 [Exobasidium rhododendri]|nr:hypothetical protein CBS101457_004040 [Exobasidium rhododendri]
MKSLPLLPLTIIAAVTRANGLGVNGTLPWKLPKEMAHFRKATCALGSSSSSEPSEFNINAVIMGRKTWESIPPKFRPLKGRINVVISRSPSKETELRLGIQEAERSYLASSLESAVEILQQSYPHLSRTYLIGGAQLYTQAMEATPKNAILDRLLITRIQDPSFDECDVFLPEFRSSSQIEEDEKGENEGKASTSQKTDSTWQRCSEANLDSFMGEEVEKGTIEEKGVRYRLQMWERAS